MSRRLILLLFIIGAMLSLGMQALISEKKPTLANFAIVERHDVRQVKAINGVLTYADEQYLLAPMSGIVSKICVQAGQRVAVNDALVRLEIPAQASMLTHIFMSTKADVAPLAQHTIRSQADCTVRQLLAKEETAVAIGSPLIKLSSNEQLICCSVMDMDADKIQPGLWAWIEHKGEKLGTASVLSVSEEEIHATTGKRDYFMITLAPSKQIDLPEGSYIDVEIFLAGSDHVLSLPIEAITDRNTVWWVNKGRCTEIPAEIVLTDEMYAWVNLPEGLLVAIGEFEEGQLVVEAES